jgi:hypothetical protein
VDLVRLEVEVWKARPELRTSFERGYRSRARWPAADVIELLVAAHALGTLAWGCAHDDDVFRDQGLEMLGRYVRIDR